MSSRAIRTNVDIPVTLITSDGHESQARILDISAAGFRIEHSEQLARGEQVRLAPQKGPAVDAIIQWCAGSEAGGIFAERAAPLQVF